MLFDRRRVADVWKIPRAKMRDDSPASIRRLKEQALLEYAAEQDEGSYQALAAAAELRRRESYTARFAIALSFLSLVVTVGVSSHYNNKQFSLAAEMPYKTALYSARVQSLRDYVRANYEVDSAIHEALLDMPYAINDPNKAPLLADDAMEADAVVARKVITAHANYVRDVDAVSAVWPESVREQLENTSNFVKGSALCFEVVGAHVLRYHEDWNTVRNQAVEICPEAKVNADLVATEMQMRDTVLAMRDNLKGVQDDLEPEEK